MPLLSKYFAKNNEQMKKHLDVCAAKEEISYCFENDQIIAFQDNFKYQGNVPFTVYFDFETTTVHTVFFDPKMFIVSYCEIYTIHPSLNLEKLVIVRSFQQNAEEIYHLSHFKREHNEFFDRTTFYQLKDTATAVLTHKKLTSLAKLFSLELKLAIDTLSNWFSNRIKPKFIELHCIKKQVFIKENPISSIKTTYCISGFLSDVETTGESKCWYDITVECGYLFLKNIYNYSEFKKMNIENIDNYYSFFNRMDL